MKDCRDCVCNYCLYWWSSRCPYGECYDDNRAKVDPYTDHHPVRKLWSNWDKPGEQAHWCRGGALYPAEDCEHFVQYAGGKVVDCARAVTVEYQDGYIECSVRQSMSCEECMKGLTEKLQEGENETEQKSMEDGPCGSRPNETGH